MRMGWAPLDFARGDTVSPLEYARGDTGLLWDGGAELTQARLQRFDAGTGSVGVDVVVGRGGAAGNRLEETALIGR